MHDFRKLRLLSFRKLHSVASFLNFALLRMVDSSKTAKTATTNIGLPKEIASKSHPDTFLRLSPVVLGKSDLKNISLKAELRLFDTTLQ